MIERNVVEILIYNDKNEILLQKKTYDYPIIPGGLWCFFGGVIENGETPLEAINREIKEELEISLENLRFLKLFTINFNNYKINRNIFTGKFTGKISDIKITEGAGFGFFDLRELSNIKLMFDDEFLIKEFFDKK